MSAATIALDAMGGDRAPAETVAGAVDAAQAGQRVLLCGPQAQMQQELARHGDVPGIEVVDAPGLIDFHDEPVAAVRARPDSSMVTACRLVREGRAQGAVSAGNTGAMLAASLLVIGRLKGVSRPGIAVMLPARDGPTVLIDAGANVDSRAEHLLQFGQLGSVFAEEVLGYQRPAVGLLSVGEEATKGDALTLEAHGLLAASDLNFQGNCEGRDALRGEIRVIVADGFAGNVVLKSLEGAGEMLFRELRTAAGSNLRSKLGGLLLMPALRGVRDQVNPEAYGGAYLLGVRGLSVIAHGNSSRVAIRNAIATAARGVEAGLVERMAERMAGSDLQDGSAARNVPLVPDPENGVS